MLLQMDVKKRMSLVEKVWLLWQGAGAFKLYTLDLNMPAQELKAFHC